jgi:hypothetical protein
MLHLNKVFNFTTFKGDKGIALATSALKKLAEGQDIIVPIEIKKSEKLDLQNTVDFLFTIKQKKHHVGVRIGDKVYVPEKLLKYVLSTMDYVIDLDEITLSSFKFSYEKAMWEKVIVPPNPEKLIGMRMKIEKTFLYKLYKVVNNFEEATFKVIDWEAIGTEGPIFDLSEKGGFRKFPMKEIKWLKPILKDDFQNLIVNVSKTSLLGYTHEGKTYYLFKKFIGKLPLVGNGIEFNYWNKVNNRFDIREPENTKCFIEDEDILELAMLFDLMDIEDTSLESNQELIEYIQQIKENVELQKSIAEEFLANGHLIKKLELAKKYNLPEVEAIIYKKASTYMLLEEEDFANEGLESLEDDFESLEEGE